MKTKLLHLSEITTTAGTQIRAKIDGDTVDQYAEAMQDASNKFPPVVVFHDGSQFILADGFHRVMAASRNGFTDIDADVRKGSRADALRFALAANSTHGLKRTNADKRRSVELALAEWPKLSDREIARICAVSDPFVGEQRQLLTVSSSPDPQTRIGADGKERKRPTRKQEPEPEPEPEAAEPKDRPHIQTAEEELSRSPQVAPIPDVSDPVCETGLKASAVKRSLHGYVNMNYGHKKPELQFALRVMALEIENWLRAL